MTDLLHVALILIVGGGAAALVAQSGAAIVDLTVYRRAGLYRGAYPPDLWWPLYWITLATVALILFGLLVAL